MKLHYLLTIALFAFLVWPSRADDHRHPPQDAAIHELFYQNWMMPDHPERSCCNKQDCYPTEIKFDRGQIYARRREDGAWIRVPPEKIERNRDNPDGRNHVCMPPPWDTRAGQVFCFSLGGAG